jgi:hypothetical protein
MITIPLLYAIIAYGILLSLLVIFLFVNLYHLTTNASLTVASFIATVIVLGLAVIIIFESWTLLSAVDWQTPIISFDFGIFTNHNIPTL